MEILQTINKDMLEWHEILEKIENNKMMIRVQKYAPYILQNITNKCLQKQRYMI